VTVNGIFKVLSSLNKESVVYFYNPEFNSIFQVLFYVVTFPHFLISSGKTAQKHVCTVSLAVCCWHRVWPTATFTFDFTQE